MNTAVVIFLIFTFLVTGIVFIEGYLSDIPYVFAGGLFIAACVYIIFRIEASKEGKG